MQATIMEIARLLGWEAYHTHDSRRSAEGFPDLVLCRDRVVFAELKREGESPRPDQVRWLDALVSADCEVYVWTIRDLAEVTSVLGSRWRLSGLASSWPHPAYRSTKAHHADAGSTRPSASRVSPEHVPSQWTAEEQRLVCTYGRCCECGAPRRSMMDKELLAFRIVCSADPSHEVAGAAT